MPKSWVQPQKFGFKAILRLDFIDFPEHCLSHCLFLLIAALMWVAERQAAWSGRHSHHNLLNVYSNFVGADLLLIGLLRDNFKAWRHLASNELEKLSQLVWKDGSHLLQVSLRGIFCELHYWRLRTKEHLMAFISRKSGCVSQKSKVNHTLFVVGTHFKPFSSHLFCFVTFNFSLSLFKILLKSQTFFELAGSPWCPWQLYLKQLNSFWHNFERTKYLTTVLRKQQEESKAWRSFTTTNNSAVLQSMKFSFDFVRNRHAWTFWEHVLPIYEILQKKRILFEGTALSGTTKGI